MYAIISKGELLALCERPRYVKRNAETGAYVEAAEAEAIGIAVGGEVYNLPGGTAIPDAPEALAQEGEAEEYVFRNHARIIENEETTNAAFAAVVVGFAVAYAAMFGFDKLKEALGQIKKNNE